MFRGRQRLQRNDRESGLVFSWRLPISSTTSLVAALVLVGLMSIGIAALVRVRIGTEPVFEDRRGSLTLVPWEEGGEALERMAIEAGPFPNRWNPAADPSYAALRGQALRQAGEVGIPYEPDLTEIAIPERPVAGGEAGGPVVLPPLPRIDPGPEPDERAEPVLGTRVIRSGAGPGLRVAGLQVSEEEATGSIGRRFMVEYDADGRVLGVVALDAEDTEVGLKGWLERGRVTGNDGEPGWLVVESRIER